MKASLEIEPLTGVLGARIKGLDLKSDLDADVIKDLRSTICEFEVAIIPDQNLSPEDQVTFSHLLGPYSPVPFVKPIDLSAFAINSKPSSLKIDLISSYGISIS